MTLRQCMYRNCGWTVIGFNWIGLDSLFIQYSGPYAAHYKGGPGSIPPKVDLLREKEIIQ